MAQPVVPSLFPAMITSFRNPLVKRIKRLRQKKYRRQEAAFFVEGLRVVLTAVEQQAPIDTLICAPELLTSEVARRVVAAQAAAGTPVVELSGDVFSSISERDNSAGLGAIVRLAERPLAALPMTAEAILVALFDVADPGNLGTILRSMDAAGAAGLILVGQTTDPFQNSVARASLGTLFTIPISLVPDEAALWPWAQRHQIQIVATSARATQPYWNAPYRRPLLLMMGSEREGLDAAVAQRAEQMVTIPMAGSASSLNLAVATSLLLYELHRAREK